MHFFFRADEFDVLLGGNGKFSLAYSPPMDAAPAACVVSQPAVLPRVPVGGYSQCPAHLALSCQNLKIPAYGSVSVFFFM